MKKIIEMEVGDSDYILGEELMKWLLEKGFFTKDTISQYATKEFTLIIEIVEK